MTEEHIGRLLDKYGDTVVRIAYTYLKNMPDAEDVVQDLFLKIMEKNPEFNDAEHEKAWMIRATINLCKSRLTTFWNRNKQPLEEAPDFGVYDTYQTDRTVLDAVLSLPDKYRIAVYMHYYEGYKTADIAKLTKEKESTVRSNLHRARNKLKIMLKEEYDFEQEI